MEQRRPTRRYIPRRPSRSYTPRRAGRAATRRAGRSCIRKRSARRYCTTTATTTTTITIGIGLKACSGVEAAENDRRIRTRDVKVGLEGEVFLTGDVADMRVNWGNTKKARDLFEKMPECAEVPWKSDRDVGFVCLGKVDVKRMNGGLLVLSAVCSISAASEQVYIGYAYFTSVNGDYEVAPRMDYCICMVGLLGRLGELTNAEETLIKEMPFFPDMAVWLTLPGACAILANSEFGALIAEQVFELDQQVDISGGMLYYNYVGGHILDEIAEVRKLTTGWRARREAVCSCVLGFQSTKPCLKSKMKCGIEENTEQNQNTHTKCKGTQDVTQFGQCVLRLPRNLQPSLSYRYNNPVILQCLLFSTKK